MKRIAAFLITLLATACGGPMEAPLGVAAGASGGSGSGGGSTATSGTSILCPTAGVLCIAARNRNGSPPEGGLLVLVIGTGFGPDSTVTYGGVPATGVSIDPSTGGLLSITPPNPEGFVDIVVTNPDGQTATSAGFHYGPPPSISGFSPSTVLRRGDLITVSGANFAVAFGVQVVVGGTVASIVSRTDTQIVFAAPKLNVGSYPFAVSNFDGQYAVAPGYLVYASGG
jgi:IPT/TIG domain